MPQRHFTYAERETIDAIQSNRNVDFVLRRVKSLIHKFPTRTVGHALRFLSHAKPSSNSTVRDRYETHRSMITLLNNILHARIEQNYNVIVRDYTIGPTLTRIQAKNGSVKFKHLNPRHHKPTHTSEIAIFSPAKDYEIAQNPKNIVYQINQLSRLVSYYAPIKKQIKPPQFTEKRLSTEELILENITWMEEVKNETAQFVANVHNTTMRIWAEEYTFQVEKKTKKELIEHPFQYSNFLFVKRASGVVFVRRIDPPRYFVPATSLILFPIKDASGLKRVSMPIRARNTGNTAYITIYKLHQRFTSRSK